MFWSVRPVIDREKLKTPISLETVIDLGSALNIWSSNRYIAALYGPEQNLCEKDLKISDFDKFQSKTFINEQIVVLKKFEKEFSSQ